MWQAVDLAFPALRAVELPASSGGYLAELRAAALRHDHATVRARFDELQRQRAPLRPGDIAIDATLQEAAVLLAVGDSAAAAAHLDAALSALPVLQLNFDQVATTGSLVRAMVLRADLAARAGDRATAARWAASAATLWANADAPLQSTVRRMRSLAGPDVR